LEIGTDKDHVHFLIQSVPKMSPTAIITTLKSLTAKEIFKKHPEVKVKLWGGEFWTDGFFVNTVSKFGDETSIRSMFVTRGFRKSTQCCIQVNSWRCFKIPRCSAARSFI